MILKSFLLLEQEMDKKIENNTEITREVLKFSYKKEVFALSARQPSSHIRGRQNKEKGRDLIQSYDKSPYTHRKKSKKQRSSYSLHYSALRLRWVLSRNSPDYFFLFPFLISNLHCYYFSLYFVTLCNLHVDFFNIILLMC